MSGCDCGAPERRGVQCDAAIELWRRAMRGQTLADFGRLSHRAADALWDEWRAHGRAVAARSGGTGE